MLLHDCERCRLKPTTCTRRLHCYNSVHLLYFNSWANCLRRTKLAHIIWYLHSPSTQIGVHMFLEFWVLGSQVGKVWCFVFVAVSGMHGLVQRHDNSPVVGFLYTKLKIRQGSFNFKESIGSVNIVSVDSFWKKLRFVHQCQLGASENTNSARPYQISNVSTTTTQL